MTAVSAAPYVGRAVPRVEDRPLLTGRGCYVDDVERGALAACVVRSPVAHGVVRFVDVSAARAHPGVVAVMTAADLPDVRIPVRMMPSDAAIPVTQPPLARDRVRYVGEPVAVVVAADAYTAEDAAALVEVDIEPLAPVLDTLSAAEVAGAAALHPEAGGNVIDRVRGVWGEPAEELLAAADAVVSDRLRIQRHAAIPIETRGLVAEHDAATGRLTVWGPTKVKHFNRTILSRLLGLGEEHIRFVEPDVGGGFGARGEFYPEDFLVPWLARELGRPVKWIEDRREHFLAINHSRETVCDLEIGASADGRVLALRAVCTVNQGAYARTHGTLLMPWILVHHLAGPYVWEGYEVEAISVLTNKTPSGTYRGPAQYEAAFLRERVLDRLAAALDMDPVELRRRNLVPVERMPFRMALDGVALPVVYDGGDFPAAFDALLDRAGYEDLAAEASAERAGGGLAGVGVATFVEEASFGQYEYARVVAVEDGRFVAYVGIASLGQGVRTALAQVLADELQVPLDAVEVVHGDTDLVPQGFGAYASRATVLGGSAVLGAAADLVSRAIAEASERLEIAEADLELVPGGVVRARGRRRGGIPLAELGVEGACRFEKAAPAFDMGACMAHVAVDAETGAVMVRRLVVCQDVGRAVNPMLVDGQLVGGAAQGVGGALLEELGYEPGGQPVTTSFMDYLMPTAAEIPPIEALALELPHHDPATENPLRVKGAGEGGLIGAGAAIANAVADAIGGDRSGAVELPLTPDRVLALLDARRAGSSHSAERAHA